MQNLDYYNNKSHMWPCGSAGKWETVVFYEYHIALVAMVQTRKYARIMTLYEYQIVHVAVEKTWKYYVKWCVLWISNHACGRGEIAQFFWIAVYYEYQIMCVAVGKCQNCAELFSITKNTSCRSREEITQMWKLLLVTNLKSRLKSHKNENCCLYQ